MQPLFLGSHPAMDFLNTLFSPAGKPVEVIANGAAFVEWLVAAGLLEATVATKLSRRFGMKALDSAASEAKKVREWAREWLVRWRADPQGDYREEVAQLNKLLSKELHSRGVIGTEEGFDLIEVPHFETASALVGLVALQLAALITREDPSLLRACAASDCTLWFLDRTKAHRRLFCSASACGNRAKVAAFRTRQRT